MYRPEDIARLRGILLLRKLRLNLKEIGSILDDPGSAEAVTVFENNLAQLDEELKSIQAVREAVSEFISALRQRCAYRWRHAYK